MNQRSVADPSDQNICSANACGKLKKIISEDKYKFLFLDWFVFSVFSLLWLFSKPPSLSGVLFKQFFNFFFRPAVGAFEKGWPRISILLLKMTLCIQHPALPVSSSELSSQSCRSSHTFRSGVVKTSLPIFARQFILPTKFFAWILSCSWCTSLKNQKPQRSLCWKILKQPFVVFSTDKLICIFLCFRRALVAFFFQSNESSHFCSMLGFWEQYGNMTMWSPHLLSCRKLVALNWMSIIICTQLCLLI